MNLSIQCSYCFGMVPAEEAECPRCGAPLEDTTQIGESREATLQEFVENSHQKLVQSGTSAAELALGVGCTLGFLVGGLLMVIIFIAITKTWTILALILFILTLISFLVSSILANRARQATTRTSYEREVKPEIDQIIGEYGLSQDEFNDMATEILPLDSPFLLYLPRQGKQV
jgi:ABC-type multidrug transport system fused ATPase/permease subunit